jgi:hypothetical protein
MTTRAFAHAPDAVASAAQPAAATHDGEVGALSQSMHGPDAKGPAGEIMLATQDLAMHLVPTWQQSVDALAGPAVLAAAGGIIAKWITIETAVQDLTHQNAGQLAPSLVEGARSALGPLAHWQFRGQAVVGPPPPPMGGDIRGYVRGRADAVARCVNDARRALDICKRAKQNGADWDFASGDEGALGMIFVGHGDLGEVGFIWEVLHQNGCTAAAEALHGPMGTIASGVREHRRSEILRTMGWRDTQAVGTTPERLEEMRKDVGKLEGFVSDHVDTGAFYLALLSKYDGHERVEIIRMLDARGALHNMAHLGGGQVEEFIQVTERTQTERIGHALKEGIKNAPGGTLNMVGSFYDGLGDLPIIGGTMKRAGDAFHSLSSTVDDKIGVNPEFVAARNAVTGLAGRFDAEVLKFGVAGELKAGEAAAKAYQIYGAGKKALSTIELVYSVVNELRTAWDEAKAGWALWTTALSELTGLMQDALIDNWTSDPKLVQHVIDHASSLFGKAIGVLGGKVKAHVTDAGKAARASKEGAAERKEERGKAVAEASASPQVKIEIALLNHATNDAINAKSDAERAQAKADMQVHAQKLRELLNPANFKDANLAEARLEREDKEWEDKAKTAKAQIEEDPGLKANVKTLAHSLGEKLKEGIIDFGVAALTAAEKELVEELKPYTVPGAKPMGVDAKKVIATGVAKGASDVATKKVTGFVRGALKGLIKAGIEKLIEEHMKGLEGIAQAFDENIDELLKYIEERLEVDEKIKKPIEEMILDMFGVAAAEPEAGKKKE